MKIWNWFKAYCAFYVLAWKEFTKTRWFRLIKPLNASFRFIVFIFLGWGLLKLYQELYPLLSGTTWVFLALLAGIVLLKFIIELLRRRVEGYIEESADHARRLEYLLREASAGHHIYFFLSIGQSVTPELIWRWIDSVRNAIDKAFDVEVLLDYEHPVFGYKNYSSDKSALTNSVLQINGILERLIERLKDQSPQP